MANTQRMGAERWRERKRDTFYLLSNKQRLQIDCLGNYLFLRSLSVWYAGSMQQQQLVFQVSLKLQSKGRDEERGIAVTIKENRHDIKCFVQMMMMMRRLGERQTLPTMTCI